MQSNQPKQTIHFQEKGASGYNAANFITKAGGAHGVLKVYVTDDHILTKTIGFMTPIAKLYGIIQEIPLKDLLSIKKINRKIHLEWKRENKSNGVFVLKLRNEQDFLEAVNFNKKNI